MTSEILLQKDRQSTIVNFNNFFTINNYFNVPKEARKASKFFRSDSSENHPQKPFAKTISLLSLENEKSKSFLKPTKSDNKIQEKPEILQETVFKKEEEEVQIIEKRNSYNDYRAEMLGYMLLITIFLFFTWFALTFMLRMCDIRTNLALFDLASQDFYYCMLLPLLLPITTLAVYGNWVAMKFFRHS